MRQLHSITDSVDTNLSKLQETVQDRGARRAAVHELQGVRHCLVTEQQVFKLNNHLNACILPDIILDAGDTKVETGSSPYGTDVLEERDRKTNE